MRTALIDTNTYFAKPSLQSSLSPSRHPGMLIHWANKRPIWRVLKGVCVCGKKLQGIFHKCFLKRKCDFWEIGRDRHKPLYGALRDLDTTLSITSIPLVAFQNSGGKISGKLEQSLHDLHAFDNMFQCYACDHILCCYKCLVPPIKLWALPPHL